MHLRRQSQLQHHPRDRLLGKRLEICCNYDYKDGSGSELLWCPGKVIMVSDGSNLKLPRARTRCYRAGEAVLMLWDANAARDEVSTESVQPLAARKWNPKGEHMEGAWRYANGDDNE